MQPLPPAGSRARFHSLLPTGLLALALFAGVPALRSAHGPAAQLGAGEWRYYNGADHYPVELDAGRLSVRFAAGVDAAAARSLLAGHAEVAVERLGQLELSEQGWTYAPLRGGLGQGEILRLRAALEADARVVFAQPAVLRTGELLGLTNRLLVSLAKHTTRQQLEALAAPAGLAIVEAIPYVEEGYVLELPRGTQRTALGLSAELMESGLFDWSLPEFVLQRVQRYTPNDPTYPSQWHLNATGQGGSKVDADVDAPEAWNLQKGSAGVVVAIIDGGVEYTHQDLSVNAVPGFDFLGNDATPLPSGTGDNHGTACAGVAVARQDNGVGLSGIAPNCKLMPIRLVGAGMTNTMEGNAIAWAKNNGAAILSNSWGPPDGTGANYPLPANVKAAIDDANATGRGGLGCVIFWASGNGNESVELDGYAKYSGVIAVGASTDQDRRSSYSDFGPSLDICAPSNGGVTSGIWTTDRTGTAGYSSGNYTSTFGGTSSACPLAAGVGALVLSQNPALTRAQVYNVLTSTADKIDTAGGGYVNGFSNLYGFGKVNAFAAVNAAGTGGGGGGGGGGGSAITINATDVPKAIPDNNTTGATSNLAVSGLTGNLTEVDVSVSISHTYKGDLTVSLIHPDGTAVILHNKTGGSADNVITTFDTLTAPAQALSAFNNKNPNGTWRLRAVDSANQDVGTLTAWALILKTGGTSSGPITSLAVASDVPKAIPDNNLTGVTSLLPVANLSGTLVDVNVSVNISHTYKGDLTVTLIHPDGTAVILHNKTGGSADNVNTTFDTVTAPAQPLTALNGKTPNGTWQLRMVDSATQDLGSLLSWSLQLVHQ